MAGYTSGTLLTCSHGECSCRVRVESECDCPEADAAYVCTCGEPMVRVASDGAEVAG